MIRFCLALVVALFSLPLSTSASDAWVEECSGRDPLTGQPSACSFRRTVADHRVRCTPDTVGKAICRVLSRPARPDPGYRLAGQVQWSFSCYGSDSDGVVLRVAGFPDRRSAMEKAEHRAQRHVYGRALSSVYLRTLVPPENTAVSWKLVRRGGIFSDRSFDLTAVQAEPLDPLALLLEPRSIRAELPADLLYGSFESLVLYSSPIVTFELSGFPDAVQVARRGCTRRWPGSQESP